MMMLVAAAAAGCLAVAPGAERITARDLAAAVPELAAAPPDERAGFAPDPGARRAFAAAELERFAARFHIALPDAPEICFERRTAPLSPERLLAAMRAALPGARIEVLEFSRYPVAEGDLTFAAASLPPPSGGSAVWRGAVIYARGRKQPVWARVKVAATARRVVAAETLPRGKAIAAAQVRVEESTGWPAARKPAADLDDVAGKSPRRSIPAGSPVFPSDLESPPDVSPGDLVAVEVRAGSARLQLTARAERSARRGEAVALRNPESKRRFLARVQGPGRAVLEGKPE